MRAASNTSHLSNLSIINRLELLKKRYGVVTIPPAMAAELSRLTHLAAQEKLTAAMNEAWIVVEHLTDRLPRLPFSLDSGEHEAIALALQTRVRGCTPRWFDCGVSPWCAAPRQVAPRDSSSQDREPSSSFVIDACTNLGTHEMQ